MLSARDGGELGRGVGVLLVGERIGAASRATRGRRLRRPSLFLLFRRCVDDDRRRRRRRRG